MPRTYLILQPEPLKGTARRAAFRIAQILCIPPDRAPAAACRFMARFLDTSDFTRTEIEQFIEKDQPYRTRQIE